MIYLIQAGDRRGPLRIGWSENPCARVIELQADSPKRLRLVATIPGERSDARAMQERFAEFRTGPAGAASWFRASRVIVQAFADAIVQHVCEGSPVEQPIETQPASEPNRATVQDARNALAWLAARRRGVGAKATAPRGDAG